MRSLAEMCFARAKLAEMREAIGRGEDVNTSYRNNTGLMWAVMERRNSIVKLLLEQPTLDLNCTNMVGRTALHCAVWFDNVEGARMLLADPRLNIYNHKDNEGKTPAMTAMLYYNEDVLLQLVAHPSVDLDTTRDVHGRSLEDCARWALVTLGGFFLFTNSFHLFAAGILGVEGYILSMRLVGDGEWKRRGKEKITRLYFHSCLFLH